MNSTREEVLAAIELTADDFVVEVGGGHQPFQRSDVIFDKYPFDNLHRSQDLVHGAPVIIADAIHLPLPDRGCDLLFGSHIIEHLPKPAEFLIEAQRCARKVYLEFPARNRELLFGWSMHEWLVEVAGTHLTFYRNDIPQLFGEFFHRNYDFLLDAWFLRRHRELNSHLYADSAQVTWEFAEIGAFEHAIRSSKHGAAKVNTAPASPVEYTWRQLAALVAQKGLPERAFGGAVQAWRSRRRGAPREITQLLLDRLICLDCRNHGLELQGSDRIVCRACGSSYGKRGGLFDLDRVGG